MGYGHSGMKCLKGQLLLASRRLADPNFYRTVVLMLQHGKDGAMGLVLNRPLELTVKQACDDALEFNCQLDDALHQGGPCQGPLMALHAHRAPILSGPGHAGRGEVFSGLYFSTERDELEWLLQLDRPKAKFFVGYSGWEPGQLEKELEGGSWLVAQASADHVFEADQSQQWSKLVTQITMGWRLDADFIPDDPSVN